MSSSTSNQTPVLQVGCSRSTHDFGLDAMEVAEALHTSSIKASRTSAGCSNGEASAASAATLTPPSVKPSVPVSPFLSHGAGRPSGGSSGGAVPTSHSAIPDCTARHSGGGAKSPTCGTAAATNLRRSVVRTVGGPNMFRKSVTAGLGGPMTHPACFQPATSSSPVTANGEPVALSDIRFYDHPGQPRYRGSRSPMATPGTASSATSTPLLRAVGRGNEPPSMILDFLYLGSVQDAQDASFLSRHNINVIINVSMEEYWSADKNIIVHTFRIEDTVNAKISVFFKPAIMIIERARRLYYRAKESGTGCCPRILVHCQKGRSRSPTIVLAYLIARNGWSVAEALEYVSKRRRYVEPNFSFMEALRELQESMSAAERTKRYSLQTLLVKNISTKTTPEMIKAFFEAHIGCVRDVVMHTRAPCPAAVAAAQSGSSEHSGAEEESAGADRKERGPVTCENALCLVFFACFEDVKRARDFAAKELAELKKLGPVEGKNVKLMAALRPGINSSSNTASFVCARGTTERAAFPAQPPPPLSLEPSAAGAAKPFPDSVNSRRRDRPSPTLTKSAN